MAPALPVGSYAAAVTRPLTTSGYPAYSCRDSRRKPWNPGQGKKSMTQVMVMWFKPAADIAGGAV
jgi:hypothetical protein